MLFHKVFANHDLQKILQENSVIIRDMQRSKQTSCIVLENIFYWIFQDPWSCHNKAWESLSKNYA